MKLRKGAGPNNENPMTTPRQPIRSVKWGLNPRSNKRPQIGENMA